MNFRTGICVLVAIFTVHAGHSEVTRAAVDAAVKQLEELVPKEMAVTGVPGVAVAVVYQGEVIFAKGYGVRDVNKKDLVNADTVFQLASLSKPLGSAVVAALVGDGAVKWDSKIRDLDPGFALQEPWVTSEITIRDLFSHRSGLPDHAGDLLEDLGFSRDQVLRRLRFVPPAYSFRTGYAYTNFGLTEAAVAAVKPGEWEAVSEEKIYKPLEMKATSSRHSDFMARKNKALGHVQGDGKWVQKFQRDPDAQSPAGGASSSVNDMARWMRMELANGKFEGKQIVEEKALAESHEPQVRTGTNRLNGLPTFYGLGWNVNYDEQGRLRLSHSGAFALGAATAVYLVPAEKLGVIVLTNSSPIGLPEGLAVTFLDEALYGKATQDWIGLFRGVFAQMIAAEAGTDYSQPPASPTAALADDAYVGKYQNDPFGEIEIVKGKDGLVVIMGPKKITAKLTHRDRDLFLYQPQGEFAAGPAGVMFTIGPDGTAESVLVENLKARFERN